MYEPAWDLSLPLLPNGPRTSLSEELAKFFSSEYLDFRCDRCGQKTLAERRFFYSRLPRVLLVHLKKFKPDGTKSHVQVDFPLRGLMVQEGDLQVCPSGPCSCCCCISRQKQREEGGRRGKEEGHEGALGDSREEQRPFLGCAACNSVPPLKGFGRKRAGIISQSISDGQESADVGGKAEQGRDAKERTVKKAVQAEKPEFEATKEAENRSHAGAEERMGTLQAKKSQEEDMEIIEKQYKQQIPGMPTEKADGCLDRGMRHLKEDLDRTLSSARATDAIASRQTLLEKGQVRRPVDKECGCEGHGRVGAFGGEEHIAPDKGGRKQRTTTGTR